MSDYEFATGTQAGWVCPICGRVYAPWVPECTYHNPGLTNMHPQTNTNTPIRDFMVNPKVDYMHKDTITQPNTGDGKFYDHLVK